MVEVVSGDTFLVLEDLPATTTSSVSSSGDEKDNSSSSGPEPSLFSPPVERRVTLSSIRAPRVGNAKGLGYELWANECRDCLRARLIGRRVLVIVDYEKPLAATQYHNNNNNNKSSTAITVDVSPLPSPGPGHQQQDQTMRYFATVKALPSYRNVALMLLQVKRVKDTSSPYTSYIITDIIIHLVITE